MKEPTSLALLGVGLLPALVVAQKSSPEPTLVPLAPVASAASQTAPDYDRWRWSRGKGRARLRAACGLAGGTAPMSILGAVGQQTA